ncbi:AAA family ATPase [Aquibacillus koreensis]|uniref:histidine kinase n=1 Tax=Aquibacillus koreensis TaxID=279446 RepID=A0A9X3WQC6_9BACI|nr:AAA family ATPase [Aquibacillus koreensis]MCT2537000.1 AAA family ATPase [Aquibacillus koreensis]MDC3422346.1 AAA family ATPase [Aquibacillus koreensis]
MAKYLESKSWILYKARRLDDYKTVLIKETKSLANATVADVIQEYNLLNDMNIDGVLSPIEYVEYRANTYLVFPFFSGMKLSTWMAEYAFDLSSFLKIAIKLTSIISNLHTHQTIHKSIHPDNILFHPQSNDVSITGFEQSTKLWKENQQQISPYHALHQVAYISPEQTGRMNLTLDHRTDLYSLGVILYEMLTGQVPFDKDNPVEVIHAHIAKIPVEPHRLNNNIPIVFSDIIMKLLSKMPADRYRTAISLKRDLEKCYDQWQKNKAIEAFPLADKDKGELFERSPKLYGRDQQMKELINGLGDAREGKPVLLLVPGPSGVGKTSLVNQLHEPILKQKGYFISGKFVKLHRQIPYAPLIGAFQSLLRQVMRESPQQVENWREKIKQALGNNADMMLRFIPELRWFISRESHEDEEVLLSSIDVHNRFRLAVRNFVDLFAQKEHPLVIFLDDLQWADRATLDLIQHLLTNKGERSLVIVGAYRDDEVQIGHSFGTMLSQITETQISFRNVRVKPLTYEDIIAWVTDILAAENQKAIQLVDYVYRITKGNPFFITQLLQSLYEEQIIAFDQSIESWQVDMDQLSDIPITETILDFLIKRVDHLPDQTKYMLQLASCVGNQFHPSLLANLTGEKEKDVAEKLQVGVQEGHVIPTNLGEQLRETDDDEFSRNKTTLTYVFTHDKVHQALYTSMSEEERKGNHLKIGEILARSYSPSQLKGNIFSVVNHFNQCIDRLTCEERLKLMEWNFLAGEKSKSSAAFQEAYRFFSLAMDLLPANGWSEYPEQTRKIMTSLGEAAYLNQLFDQAEHTFKEVLNNAQTNQEKLIIYRLKIMLYTHIHEVEKATEAGLTGLGLFGWKFDRNPNKAQVAIEYIRTKITLGKKESKDLLALPPVADEVKHMLMQTLINTNASAYHVNQNLATILMLRALRLTLKYGDMDLSALVYNNFALTLSAGFGDYDGSYQYGKLAIDHAESRGDLALKARVYFVFGAFVNHWKRHMRHSLEYLKQSQQLCVEVGNLHLAGANASFIGIATFSKGDPLSEVKTTIEKQIDFSRKNEYKISNDFLTELNGWISHLTDPKNEPEWNFTPITEDMSAEIIHKTLRLQMAYLFNHSEYTNTVITELEKLVEKALMLVVAPDFYMYHSLWISRFVQDGRIRRTQAARKLRKNLIKLKKWAKHAPENFEHKYELVKAEFASMMGRNSQAAIHYHQAIELAETNGYIQDVAIANLCAAKHFISNNLDRTAKAYMSEAYNFFEQWGATTVTESILNNDGHLILKPVRTGELAELGVHIDTQTILQASRVLSGEVKFEKLLEKMMDIVLTNAGAERAFFILYQDQQLQLVAHNNVDGEVQVCPEALPIHDATSFSVNIVNYVASTEEPVVLGHAVKRGVFMTDSYIQAKQIKSVLSIPILSQNKLLGVLYLENNQSTNAFTRERIQVLTMLSSQIAISIDNANLYASLEQKVEKRTRLLQEVNEKLQVVNQDLANERELRQKLFSNVSHDLRSPIAAIQGYVDAILDGVVEEPSKQRGYLEKVSKKVKSLDRLIQDLFELAKLESGQIKLNKDVAPVDQLFIHLCSQFELDVQQAGLNYRWHYPPEDNYLLVEVDVIRLEQVMTNIITNAIKHTSEGTIEVTLKFNEKKEMIIGVKDEGVGIPKSEVDFVFDRFYTKGSKEKKKGNGLGLAISKEIVMLHQGNVWVESNEGEGAAFYFSLPMFDVEWTVDEDPAVTNEKEQLYK